MSVLTPQAPSAPSGGKQPRHLKRWLLGALAVASAVGSTAGLLVATGSPEPEASSPTTAPDAGGPSGTGPTPSQATPPPTTPSPTTAPPTASPEVASGVFPAPGSGTRFVDPVAAARAFAVDFVGFVGPVVGQFVATGDQSGAVEVRAAPGGAVTTVRLHHATGSWWALGSSTPDIRVDSPAASSVISSPVRLEGMSTAFEAQVNVEVRQDGARSPIGTGQVTGGSMGTMAPFDGSIAFSSPDVRRGALALFTVSMKSGTVHEATVVPVAFSPAVSVAPVSACPDYSMDRPAATTGEMVVAVFYACSVDAVPVPTYRLYPATTAVMRTALDQLLAGPSASERAAGLTSPFSSSTSTYVRGVSLTSGQATVDFGDLRAVIPDATTTAGSHPLLSQLDATVLQFPTVTSAIYRIDGSCQTFGEWLQIDGCAPRIPSTRP